MVTGAASQFPGSTPCALASRGSQALYRHGPARPDHQHPQGRFHRCVRADGPVEPDDDDRGRPFRRSTRYFSAYGARPHARLRAAGRRPFTVMVRLDRTISIPRRAFTGVFGPMVRSSRTMTIEGGLSAARRAISARMGLDPMRACEPRVAGLLPSWSGSTGPSASPGALSPVCSGRWSGRAGP